MNTVGRRNLLILSFTLLVVMLGYSMAMPLLPFYIEAFGVGGTRASIQNKSPGALLRGFSLSSRDQVRVRIRIMKLSNPSSATCSQAKESARNGTTLS